MQFLNDNLRNLTWEDLNMAKKRKLNLLFENNNIRANYINSNIDKMQKNSKNRLTGYRDETIIHKISECNKLAQKVYKTKHDSVG